MYRTIFLLAFALFFVTFTPVFAQEPITIIEAEPNPSGTDAGNEWVKLYNSGNDSVNLSGWIIRTGDGQTYTISNIVISACSEMKITFPSQFLDNQQETVTLIDASQNLVDQTPFITDTDNDGTTWSVSKPVCEPVTTPDVSLTDTPTTNSDNFLTVVFIDLGTKGESILVIYPNGKTMLIDGGMPGAYSNLESTLKQYNISDIDIMVGTHADQDHIAGLTKVLDDSDFTVHQVLISYIPSDTNTYQNFLAEISDNNLQPQTVFDGHDITLDETVASKIISPPTNGIQDATHATPSNSNALVALIEYDDVSFLFTSDASFTTEDYIVQNHLVDIDIMNSPHHGSKYSSTDAFLDVVTPKLVVFSADQDNMYGHPDPEIISNYDDKSINHYQTGLDGNIVIKTDGIRCSLFIEGMPEQPCYSGVQVVPEFPLAAVMLLIAMSTAVLSVKFRSSLSL